MKLHSSQGEVNVNKLNKWEYVRAVIELLIYLIFAFSVAGFLLLAVSHLRG